jgi:hypothetical protein
MLRRFILAAFAAALALPAFSVTPASAAIIGVCTTFEGSATIAPGLGNTKQAQTDVNATGYLECLVSEAGNGLVFLGSGFGLSPVTSYPQRPLGCPVALGGAVGNDYADQTPILIGPAFPSFEMYWELGESKGITKVKASTTGNQWRLVLVITSGQYAPPPGMKTKIKGQVNFVPVGTLGTDWDCSATAGNTNPIESVTLTNNGLFTIQQV